MKLPARMVRPLQSKWAATVSLTNGTARRGSIIAGYNTKKVAAGSRRQARLSCRLTRLAASVVRALRYKNVAVG
jgi:hypothetical protein